MTVTELGGMGSLMLLVHERHLRGGKGTVEEDGVVDQEDLVKMLHGKIGKGGINEIQRANRNPDSSRIALSCP